MDSKVTEPMNVYVYENRNEALNLEPIALTRPAFDLRCGAFTFLERIQRALPDAQIALFVRKELESTTRDRFLGFEINPEEVEAGLWLNGTAFWERSVADLWSEARNRRYFSDRRFLGASLDSHWGNKWIKEGGPVYASMEDSVKRRDIRVDSIAYLWECVNLCEEVLERDSSFFNLGTVAGEVDEGAHLLNPKNIYVGANSKVKAGSVLDAEEGAIMIGSNVTVLPQAYLQGPLFVGDRCLIKAGAKVYGGTSIGPGCKIGGEVAEAIFQSWSNKQHDGFIGHAYIGEWVNIGADTNNSDLKNNYSDVKVTVNGKVIDTGSKFVGMFMGDHSKTGINTQLNTGTSVGPASNIVGHGFPSKSIPPFSWVVNGEISQYQFDRFVETASIVMGRRDQEFSSNEEILYHQIFETYLPAAD